MKQRMALTILMFVILCGCKENDGFYKPKYLDNRYRGESGTRRTNILNRERVKREEMRIKALEQADAALAKLEQFEADYNSINETVRIDEINSSRESIRIKIENIRTTLKETDPYTPEGFEMSLKMSAELNDLLYQEVMPVGLMTMMNKNVRLLEADLSFATGSSTLTNAGNVQISNILDKILKEMEVWEKYLQDHNMGVFRGDRYKVIIRVTGYADRQGPLNESQRIELNLQISKDRALAVAEELNRQMKEHQSRYNLIIDMKTPTGKGEELPPGVIDNGQLDDPSRRICAITSVVGPVSLLKE